MIELKTFEHYDVKKELKEYQIKNLYLLADYLENNVDEQFFEMGDFLDKNDPRIDELEEDENNDDFSLHQNVCGTAACACGWAPFIEGIDFAELTGKISNPVFDKTMKVFKIQKMDCDYSDIAGVCFTNFDDEIFEFLFSGAWSNIDNSPKGAAKRIKYMLEYGLPNNEMTTVTDLFEDVVDGSTYRLYDEQIDDFRELSKYIIHEWKIEPVLL